MVTSLLFALPINALFTRRRVTRWEWTWAALLAAAVAVIVTVGNPTAGHSLASLETWTVVSGALWGVFAVLTKGVVERLDGGLLALLRTPELYVWVLVAIAGTAWQQSSFRAGALTASLPTMTVAQPVVGSVLGIVVVGIVVLGETLRPGDAGWLTLAVAVAVMVAATVALARGEAAVATRQPA
jgi:hypothetical protein